MKKNNYFSIALFIGSIILLGNNVFAQDKKQTQPAVVSAVAPVYTVAALALKLEGDFHVDVEIDRSGKVVSSKAVEGTSKHLRGTLEAAAERWQFAPDKNAKKKRRVQLTFTFRSMPKASNPDSTTVFYPPYKIEVRNNTELRNNPSS